MKITVTTITPSKDGLRLGLRVEHEKAGWIRFATTVLLVEDLDHEDRCALTKALDNAALKWHEDLADVPLFG